MGTIGAVDHPRTMLFPTPGVDHMPPWVTLDPLQIAGITIVEAVHGMEHGAVDHFVLHGHAPERCMTLVEACETRGLLHHEWPAEDHLMQRSHGIYMDAARAGR